MLSREIIEQETAADIARVAITKDDIARVAASLRSGELSAGAKYPGCLRTEVELAAIVRLQAAALLGLGQMLDAFDDAALAAAIAAVPLRDIDGYYYVAAGELLDHAAGYEARHKARELHWRWLRSRSNRVGASVRGAV